MMQVKRTKVNVLVTGMGPYPDGMGVHVDPNISHVLSTILPSQLTPGTSINPSAYIINIIHLPYPVKTEYAFIRKFCQHLHARHVDSVDGEKLDTNDGNSGSNNNDIIQNDVDVHPQYSNGHSTNSEQTLQTYPNIDSDDLDLVIHLGEARGWQYISIERMAFKQGFTSSWWGPQQAKAYYDIPDDVGRNVLDIGPCPWDDVPMGLQSPLDIDLMAFDANAILRNRYRFRQQLDVSDRNGEVSQHRQDDHAGHGIHDIHDEHRVSSPNEPINISPHREGGFYCCGFTYYESLASSYVNKRIPNVPFCHVPGESDQLSLERGRDGVMSIVVAAVTQIVQQRRDTSINVSHRELEPTFPL